MYNNQQGILDSMVSNDKKQLRGGGICSSQSNKQTLRQKLENRLKQSLKINGVFDQTLIKEILDLIVNIYKDEIDNQNVSQKNQYDLKFNVHIQAINEILLKKDFFVEKWCLEYYLELISISLENLQSNESLNKNKGINIIEIFIQISKQQNNNQSISQLIEAANILLINVQQRYYYQLEKFETYFFFITLNQIIKEKVAQGVQIEFTQYFDRIKHQYIQNSSNWTLHHCWIEFLVDILNFCDKQQEQNNLQAQQIQKVVTIIAYVKNYEAKKLLQTDITNFTYQYNHEHHRLWRIISMFNGLIKQIEIQFEELKLSNDSSKIYQIYQNIYSDFMITQIYSLEMLESVYKIEANIQHEQENLQLIKHLIKYAKQEIENHFNIESIVNCYCQLQMIEINKFDKNKIFTDKMNEQLKGQIEKFSSIVTVVQTFILQERLLQSNIKFHKNKLDSNIKKILQSQVFVSIQQSSPNIERQEDLKLQIKIHLQKYKKITLFQKIYNFKLNQNNISEDQHLKEIKEKKKALKELYFVINNNQQLNEYKAVNIQRYIHKGQANRGFQDQCQLPLIYKEIYKEIESILVQSDENEYKIRQYLKFNFQTIKDNPISQNLWKSQKFVEILTQFDSVNNTSTQSSLGVEKNLELKTIIKKKADNYENKKKKKEKHKIQIALNTQQQKRYDDLENQIVKVDQARQLFKEFGSNQDPKDFLDAEINDFIWSKENQNVVLVISGPNGCGKTKTLKKLEKQLQQHYNDNPQGHNWIPIYVNLLSINQPEKNLLIKAIKSQYRELNKIIQEFYIAILKGQEKVVLILDDYNSSKDDYNSSKDIINQNQFQKKIKNLLQKVTLKIIIATRKDIRDIKDIKDIKKNIQFTKISLINRDQQEEYINQNTEQLSQNNFILKNFLIHHLKYIFVTPLLLKIAIKYLNTKQENILNSIILQGKVKDLSQDLELILLPIDAQMFSKYKILKSFIQQCHKYEKSKRKNQDLHLGIKKIFKFSCLNNLNEESQEKPLILLNNQNGIGIQILDLNSITNSSLIAIQNDQIEFLHPQFLNFYIARLLEMLLSSGSIDEIMKFLNNQQVNLSQMENKGAVELLLVDNTIKGYLKNIVRLSITDIKRVRALSNGIFLLSKMGASLKNLNFEGIQIENTSMIGLNMINCNFINCKMKNVDIDFCNFHDCKFINSEFQDVSCCEFPEINQKEEVLQVIPFEQDQKLAVLTKNGNVYIWTVETVESIQLETENKYKQIIISKDNSTLIALTDSQIIFWNLHNESSKALISLVSKSKYMCLSPDFALLLICSVQNQDIEIVKYKKEPIDQIWKKQEMALSFQQDAVQMAINNSNELLAFRNKSNQIKFLDLSTSNEIIINQQMFGNAFTTTIDGEKLIIQHNNQIDLYQFKISNGTLNKLHCFNISKLENPIGLHICENSETILIQSQSQTKILYLKTMQVQQLPIRFYGQNSVLSRNGAIFINWKGDKVQLWDLKTLIKIHQRKARKDYVKYCQYSPDGLRILIVLSKKTLFYSIDQKTYYCIFESFSSFCFNPIIEMLVTFSKQGLKVWKFESNNQLKLSQQFDTIQQFQVKKLIFSSKGEWLVLCHENIISIMQVDKILKLKQQIGLLDNIQQIPEFNYNEKNQFYFGINFFQYSFDTKQLLKFDPRNQQREMLKQFDSNYEAYTFSPLGEYIAFVNKSDKNVIIYKILNEKNFFDYFEHEINIIQFSNNEKQLYVVTSNPTEIKIYCFKETIGIRMLSQIQIIRLNQRVHSLQFHPKVLQFLVVVENGEILFYKTKQDSDQYQMSKKMTDSDELCSLNTNITLLKITSQIQQQNLRILLIQKGAKTQIINT